MNLTCNTCGEPLFMRGNAGQYVWLCPRRFDGYHYEAASYTSDTTSAPTMDRGDPVEVAGSWWIGMWEP